MKEALSSPDAGPARLGHLARLAKAAARPVASRRSLGPALGVRATAAGAASEGLTLQATAEAELGRSGWRLAFPPALEQRYRSDSEAERVRELRTIVGRAAVLYLAIGVAAKVVLADPAPWWISAAQLVGTSIAVLLLVHRFFRVGTPGAAREAALLACCLTFAIAELVFTDVMQFAHMARPAPVPDYFIVDILPVNLVLIFVPLRFLAAVAFLAVSSGMFTATILALDPLGGAARCCPSA